MTSTDLDNRIGIPTASQIDFILLDGSSSMMDKWYPSLAALDAYVDTLRRGNCNTTLILHTFSGQVLDLEQRNQAIADWKPLATDPTIGSTWGMTPLHDAINSMGRRLRDLDPARCSILIVTDGEENASHYTDQTQAKSILDWCRAKGWQVTFIGANFDNTEQAALLGGNAQSAIGVHKELLEDATKALADKRLNYGLYGTPMHWTSDEQSQFGGFLEDQSAQDQSNG